MQKHEKHYRMTDFESARVCFCVNETIKTTLQTYLQKVNIHPIEYSTDNASGRSENMINLAENSASIFLLAETSARIFPAHLELGENFAWSLTPGRDLGDKFTCSPRAR